MNDEFSMRRLREEIIFSTKQFQKYAKMQHLDRNNYVVTVLEELLIEAKKWQLYHSELDEKLSNE
jgi:hypothetical protein